MGIVMRAIDALLPPGCAGCGTTVSPGPPICPVCRRAVDQVPRPWCRRCGAPAPREKFLAACDLCADWPASLKRAASATLFVAPADRLIAGLKYRGWTALVPALSSSMVEPARRIGAGSAPILMPVPLAEDRRRRRGFNQAELLATELGRELDWSVGRGLSRRPGQRRQAELRRAARATNVEGAIFWDARVPPPLRPVLLVDDVLTTGATAAACARAVAGAGAECLGVVTFARALPRPDED